MKMPLSSLELVGLPTEYGVFVVGYSSAGLALLDFPETSPSPDPRPVPPNVLAWHSSVLAAVTAVLNGTSFVTLPPLDLSAGSSFQQRVWHELQTIPSGKCRTYGEIAKRLGRPGGSRAVGGACGANPVPLLVPCHRVLAAGGKLGGFSGGLDWKRRLLSIERAELEF
jgi:methylated-DNA-[protein]-cysteine S-methyltransferase